MINYKQWIERHLNNAIEEAKEIGFALSRGDERRANKAEKYFYKELERIEELEVKRLTKENK